LIIWGLIALRLIYSLSIAWILQHLVYPPLLYRFGGHDTTLTRLHAIIICLFIAGNITCALLNDLSLDSIRIRTGHLALINLIALGIIGRINPMIDCCGLSCERQAQLHRWVGRMAVAHGVVHCGLSTFGPMRKQDNSQVAAYIVSSHRKIWDRQSLTISAAKAASALGGLLILSLGIIRRLVFEIFAAFHVALAATLLITIFVHVPKESTAVKIYIVVAASSWIAAVVMRFMVMGYRSMGCRAQILGYQDSDAVQVSVTLPRPWKFQPGQYAYLRLCKEMGFPYCYDYPIWVFSIVHW
jgi:predicted ferric reductase